MNITYAICNKCKKHLFSFHRHDFNTCGCGNGIDGGVDYYKLTGDVLTVTSNIKDIIEEIREYFIWGKNYDKDMNRLLQTEFIVLKNMNTDHIIAILIYFTNRLYEYSNITNEWKQSHLIFLEELNYRYKNKKLW